VPGAAFGVLAFGTTRYALEEARDQLREAGLEFSFLRLRALPIGPEVRAFVENLSRVYVLELNRDGQLCGILRSELPDLAAKLVPVAHLDGMPLTASWVRERLKKEEESRA
jgi:2-oxoglutarate/2-oxoacid ferredoxin oxidoreductase subunit alpha